MQFTYCPNCANKLEQKEKNLSVCPNCDFHLFKNPVASNAAILKNNNGDILLVKRKYDPKKGYWDLPGGFINTEETVEESIRREIKEELGVEMQNLTYFASYHDRYEYKGLNYYTICMTFTAQITQEVQIADDVEEATFFQKDAIPFDRIAFPTLVRALQEYIGSTSTK